MEWRANAHGAVTGGVLENSDSNCFDLVPTPGETYVDFDARLQTMSGGATVDLREAMYAWVDIENIGTNDTYMWLRIGNRAASDGHKERQRHALVLKAGERIAFQFALARSADWHTSTVDDSVTYLQLLNYPEQGLVTAYGALRGAPPHLTTTWGLNYDDSALQAFNQFLVRMGEPITGDAPSSVRFCNPRYTVWNEQPIRLRATPYTPARTTNQEQGALDEANFLPWIDVFGQRLYGDWPGRVTAHTDFPAHKAQEIAWLAAQPGPSAWTEYGGYVPAGNHHGGGGTGHFRTQKINDKWWLIDPLGYPFFSVGINGIGNSGGVTSNYKFDVDRAPWQERCSSATTTGVPPAMQGRCGNDEFYHYFEEAIVYKHGIADVNNPSNYNTSLLDHSTAQGYANLAQYDEMILARLKTWGVNTQGSWSVYQVNAMKIGEFTDYPTQIPGIENGMRVPYAFFVNSPIFIAFTW